MKYRNGFVSNSSSSSFIITKFSEEEVKTYIEKLIESLNVVSEEKTSVDDILYTYTIDDADEHRLEHYNWGCWDDQNKLTIKQYKNMNERKNIVEKAVVVQSTSDNSIPWFIQEALENIGERFHWG